MATTPIDQSTCESSEQKDTAQTWFMHLRDLICAEFEAIEREARNPRQRERDPGHFEQTSWDRPGGGGGVMSVLRGRVFEKVGVNFSCVSGEFSEKFRGQIPGAEEDPRFWASGISLVAHPCSPYVPPVHMNTRHIRTSKTWFGGAADLNPIFIDNRDTREFHDQFRHTCDRFAIDAYDRFSQWADDYFYIPHREEARGVGGIFFDYLEDEFEQDFEFVRDVGRTFLATYPPLVRRHMNRSWSAEARRFQMYRRGRYAEFNMIYDRGTKFGLMTGGNAEAILMSLPPITAWP
ncbi:MAG: oxygen-dependent coproporphyrinogen oxidase [Pseudomonadota bacterium]